MFMGFTSHFYIIFGTNLLTGGPSQIVGFLPISVFRRKKYIERSPNGMKPSGTWFLEQTWSRGLGVDVKQSTRRPRGREVRPPPSWAPRCSTGILLPPIYTYVPPNYQTRSQKPNSTAATFCTREIPSWSLFRSSAGGGIDHGGLLHQHHSLSDDVWVVYLRPSGP